MAKHDDLKVSVIEARPDDRRSSPEARRYRRNAITGAV